MSEYDDIKQRTFELMKQQCIDDYKSGKKSIDEIESMLSMSDFDFREITEIVSILRCIRSDKDNQ